MHTLILAKKLLEFAQSTPCWWKGGTVSVSMLLCVLPSVPVRRRGDLSCSGCLGAPSWASTDPLSYARLSWLPTYDHRVSSALTDPLQQHPYSTYTTELSRRMRR
jgi:hypothetical protein